jgi:hypothetical protein
MEWLYYDVFYLDTPSFTEPKAPAFAMVNCSGRDAFKRAIESDINLPDLSGGKAIDDLIKDICDNVGIQYSNTSIANLVNFGNRVLADGYGANQPSKQLPKAVEVFENCMQIINRGDNHYQMYMEYDANIDDNILFVQPIPSTYTTDAVFNYQHYDSIGDNKKNYDKLLKTMTVITDQQTADKEEQLSQDTFSSAGLKIISWSGEAEYKRFTVTTNTGDGGDTSATVSQVNPENIHLNVTGSGPNITVTTYGNKWDSTAPSFEGEWINYDNMANNKGVTSRIVNPLVISDEEAKDIAKGFITKFGVPIDETKKLVYPYINFLLEQNDMALLWSRFVFKDDLRFVNAITYNWSRAQDSISVNLEDSGLNFTDEGDFIYDRDQAPVSGTIMLYDIGFLYDMADGPLATDAEIDANTTILHNVEVS